MIKILLITCHDPFNTGYGAGQRTNQLWSALKRIGKLDVAYMIESDKDSMTRYEIDEVTFTNLETKPAKLSDYWWNALKSKKLKAALNTYFTTTEYDIIVSRYITPAIKLNLENSRKLLIDFDDPIYKFPKPPYNDLRAFLKATIRLINQGVVAWKIRHSHLNSAHYLFINSRDRDDFPFLDGGLLHNVPHFTSTPNIFSRQYNNEKIVIFIGLMTYHPNIEAVDYFLDKIWPDILKGCPNAIFRIVGKIAQNERERWLSHTNCTVDGYVKDLAEVYATASIAVSPILSGGGSNIKIPEACAYGCPVVATEYSYSGWSDIFRRDIDIAVGQTASDFSKKCRQLLTNTELAKSMSENSSKIVKLDLSLLSFTNRLNNLIHNFLAKTSNT